MASLIVSEFVTLDGIIESPHHWSLAYSNDEIRRIKHAELFAAGALLLGRVTYEGFAAAWPGRRGSDDYADCINDLPKFVASTTLRNPTWSGTRVLGDTLAEVRALKHAIEGDIVVFGSNRLAVSLLHAGLVDEVRVLSYPVVRGSGLRLFQDGSAKLELTSSRALPGDVVYMTYRPVAHEARVTAAA